MSFFEQVSREYLIGQFLAKHHHATNNMVLQTSGNALKQQFVCSIGIREFAQSYRGLEMLERVCTRSHITLLDCLPVDDVPDILHIGSFSIEVLASVSVVLVM